MHPCRFVYRIIEYCYIPVQMPEMWKVFSGHDIIVWREPHPYQSQWSWDLVNGWLVVGTWIIQPIHYQVPDIRPDEAHQWITHVTLSRDMGLNSLLGPSLEFYQIYRFFRVLMSLQWKSSGCSWNDIAVLVVNYVISNTTVLKIP